MTFEAPFRLPLRQCGVWLSALLALDLHFPMSLDAAVVRARGRVHARNTLRRHGDGRSSVHTAHHLHPPAPPPPTPLPPHYHRCCCCCRYPPASSPLCCSAHPPALPAPPTPHPPAQLRLGLVLAVQEAWVGRGCGGAQQLQRAGCAAEPAVVGSGDAAAAAAVGAAVPLQALPATQATHAAPARHSNSVRVVGTLPHPPPLVHEPRQSSDSTLRWLGAARR